MNPTEINLDDFFDSAVTDALVDGASRALPDGSYRWKVTKVIALEQHGQYINKSIMFEGINADTGERINREWRLTGKAGEINRLVVSRLSEQLVRAGVTKPLKAIIASNEQLPIFTLLISSRVSDGKLYPEQSILACEDQTLKITPDASQDHDEAPFG